MARRAPSVSLSSTTSPYFDVEGLSFAAPPTAPTRPKLLKQASSMADLRNTVKGKWLKRFKKGDGLDFGCGGDCGGLEDEECEEEDEGSDLPALPHTAPPVYTSFNSKRSSSASGRSGTSSHDARAEARRLEEADGVDACLAYMSRTNSLSSQKDPRPLIDIASLPHLSAQHLESRPRSSSISSSFTSSRPRTNDSLPSYNSQPPSPLIPPPTLFRRPTLPSGTSTPLHTPEPAAGPRSYGFI